jgi:chitinase
MNFLRCVPVIFLLASIPLAAQQSAIFGGENPQASTASRYRIVGYYPQWGIDGQPAYNVKNVITSGSAPLLTHLIYAFANIAGNRCASYDPGEDYQIALPASETVDGKADVQGTFAGNFHQLKELKAKYPKLEILISIGGGSMDPKIFAEAAEPANRKTFVASCIAMYIKGEFAKGITQPGIFTGIDIDWEFPATDADRSNYLALLEEFRRQLNAAGHGYLLTSTSPTGSWAWDYMDLNVAQSYVNFFNAMMYDFDGPWSNETGFVAPLYRTKLDPDPANNADYAVRSYLDMGVERSKIVFGMPFYAYHWTGVPRTDDGLFQPGVADQNGYEYWNVIALKGYTKHRDEITHEPWLYSKSDRSFWTYDDPTSLGFKTKYVVDKQLGGVMFWELSGDTPDGTLIKALAGSL